MEKMRENVSVAADFLKGLSHKSRLLILCKLVEGEHNVSQLIEFTGLAQSSMSQHLKKLKDEDIIDYRRDHRTLYYYIKDPSVLRIMGVLHDVFCKK
ncbi:MAG: transcriptional regulator [Micavibrio sp.]|nr:transcriptional regulator [Micavibrio sp.]|tara:strand:- start:3578 stop:3868 length:291 start_codon:yes stop_codon:yes gene_type:complete